MAQQMKNQRMAFAGFADHNPLDVLAPTDWSMPRGDRAMAGWWLLPCVAMGALMWLWLFYMAFM